MLSALRRRLARAAFLATARGVGATPAISPGHVPVHVVSMVRTEHLSMYLLAVKGFLRQIPARKVTVLDDGSLTPSDHAVLRRHVPHLRITPLSEIGTGACPQGGCWERLLHILDLTAEDYVIQLDSDVLVVRPTPEVAAAITRNHSFTLGTGPDFRVMSLAEAAAAIPAEAMAELQAAAEAALARIPEGLGQRYVRGSAGFAGFARGGPGRAQAEAFSSAMQAQLGSRWREWGTEQVASNFLVANGPGGHALPWPRYCCFYGGPEADGAALIHFIGTWRFQRGLYRGLARRMIAELRQGGADAATWPRGQDMF